jgi:hypothetical protein
MRDIKERVFVDRFSRKRYADLDEQYFGNHKETITEGLEILNIGDHETNTEGVEILNIVPYDWEQDSLISTEGEEFTQEHLYLSDKEKDRTKPNLYDCPRCGLESMTCGDLRDHLDNVHSQDINEIKDMTTCTCPLYLQGPGCNGKGEKLNLGSNEIRKRNSKMDSASFIPLIEADRGNKIWPSVVHTVTDTLDATVSSTRGERYRDDRQGGDGGRYGDARQGRCRGGDDHQGGGGSGRHGDDRSGRGALGRRSGKERTDCRPCGTGVIITKKDGIIHVESKHQKNSRMQRKEAAKARIEKKKRGKERKRLAKKVAEEAEAAAKAMKAAAKAKKAATKAKKTAAKAEGLDNLNYGLI